MLDDLRRMFRRLSIKAKVLLWVIGFVFVGFIEYMMNLFGVTWGNRSFILLIVVSISIAIGLGLYLYVKSRGKV